MTLITKLQILTNKEEGMTPKRSRERSCGDHHAPWRAAGHCISFQQPLCSFLVYLIPLLCSLPTSYVTYYLWAAQILN